MILHMMLCTQHLKTTVTTAVCRDYNTNLRDYGMFTKVQDKTTSGKDFAFTTADTDSNVTNMSLVLTVIFGRVGSGGGGSY